MDDMVKAAMAKWPNVPAVFGWLQLSARGDWLLRGERLQHAALLDFIGRNYLCDAAGRFFFQNGPQQVFVRLVRAPWVVAPDGAGILHTHTGLPVQQIDAVYLDEQGQVWLQCEHGPASLDDRAMLWFANELDEAAMQWRSLTLHAIGSEQVACHLGFVADPQQTA